MARCSYLIPNKGRCEGVAIRGSTLCAAHDPSTQGKRRAGARKGGRSRGSQEIRSIKAEIKGLIRDVLKGDTPTGCGAVALQGFNTLLRAVEAERRWLETEDLASELEELRRELSA